MAHETPELSLGCEPSVAFPNSISSDLHPQEAGRQMQTAYADSFNSSPFPVLTLYPI